MGKTLRDILSERSFMSEYEDAKHPIQSDIEKKLFEKLYEIDIKKAMAAFEAKYKVLDVESYDDLVKLYQSKKPELGDVKMDMFRKEVRVSVSISWHVRDMDADYITKTNNDNIVIKTTGDNDFQAFKKKYLEIMNGNVDTMIKNKLGAGKWPLYRGTIFFIGDNMDCGFKLTDDYKIVDCSADDIKDYKEWPTATIAKFVLGYYNKINENPNKKYSQEQKKVYELALRAKKKFENALEFKEYLDKTPEMKAKFSELISSPNLLGKHRS